MGTLKFALQLYTVRDHLEKDVSGTLAKVKKIGYDWVEGAGTCGLTHDAFRKCLDAAGLKACSVHVGYEDVTQHASNVVEWARVYDVKYVVISSIDSRLTPNREGWTTCGKALDVAGAALRKSGVQLCYHNHAHEFQRFGDEYAYDLLLGAAKRENLAAQIDTFWVRYAGLDPVTLIKQYSRRCPLLHVKDMADADSRAFAEAGSGILPWPDIFAAAAKAGTEWYIVEQDVCARDSLESAETSAKFMARQ